MNVLTVIFVIAIVGLILWAIEQYLPMSAPIKRLLQIVVVIILIIWLLQGFGVWDDVRGVKI